MTQVCRLKRDNGKPFLYGKFVERREDFELWCGSDYED